MLGMESVTKPYEWDLQLFEKLGLKPFEAEHWEKTYVGEVIEKDYYKVKIWVTCVPAQFWEFEIFNIEARKVTHKFKTGSGDFSQYWDVAKRFAEGMISMIECVVEKEKGLKG